MSNHLDMSLEQIIRKNNNRRTRNTGFKPRRGRTSASIMGPGPNRRFNHLQPIKPQPYPVPFARQEQQLMLMPIGGLGGESGAKLYVSNLDYGVSNGDIKLLFTDVGELVRYSIHYDKSGRSKGTAEVVFVHHADALAAIKRYNNVNLDGKPMKIEVVGANALVPVPSAAASNVINPTFNYQSDQQSTRIRAHLRIGTSMTDHDGRHGYGRGQRQQKHNGGEKVTVQELNADLDKYRAQTTSSN